MAKPVRSNTSRPHPALRGKPPAKTPWKPGNAVFPSPAALVSCQRPGERANLITIAWCGNINSDPPMLSISVRPSRHSHAIICETNEFAVNIPSVEQAGAVDYCGVASGASIDKFAASGLTAMPASSLACPLVAECPVNIECRVRQRLELGTHTMFVAEVVAVTVSRELLDSQGRFRLDRAGLLLYAHGHYYGLGKEQGHFGWSVRKKPAPAMEKRPPTGQARASRRRRE